MVCQKFQNQTRQGSLPEIVEVDGFSSSVFFFYLGFLSLTWIIHRTAREGGDYFCFLNPLYHFYLLHRYLDISRAIFAESSPLHIARSRTRTQKLFKFKAGADSFHAKNFLSSNTTDFAFYPSYIIAIKKIIFIFMV